MKKIAFYVWAVVVILLGIITSSVLLFEAALEVIAYIAAKIIASVP